MPVVFVHGVNNRRGPAYEAGTLATQEFLKRHLIGSKIAGKTLAAIPKVWFPYWGDLASKFVWDMASLPQGDMQALGVAADAALEPLVGHLRDALGRLESEPLTTLAKKRLSLAVDVLSQMALDNAPAGHEAEVAEFVVQASTYAEANPSPPWLANVHNDTQLIATLKAQLTPPPAVQAQGGFGQVFNKLTLAGAKLKQTVIGLTGKAVDKAGDFASTKLLAWSRDSLNGTLGRFFGDIFVYMDLRGNQNHPGPIPTLILAAFDEAQQQSPAGEPLIIIGHSLGGVITMDLLSHFRPSLEVDLFISVGSQVAHFEEMKLYKVSDPHLGPPKKAKTPANIHHWINVYDEVDVFSYAVERVFDRVDVDARYDTQTYVVKSHSAYFEQVRFYQRLRERIEGLP